MSLKFLQHEDIVSAGRHTHQWLKEIEEIGNFFKMTRRRGVNRQNTYIELSGTEYQVCKIYQTLYMYRLLRETRKGWADEYR